MFSYVGISAWTLLPCSMADGKSLGGFKMQLNTFMEGKFSPELTRERYNLWLNKSSSWLLSGTGLAAGQILTGAEHAGPLLQHDFRNKVAPLLDFYDCRLFLRQLWSWCWSVETQWNQWQFFSVVKVRKKYAKSFSASCHENNFMTAFVVQ